MLKSDLKQIIDDLKKIIKIPIRINRRTLAILLVILIGYGSIFLIDEYVRNVFSKIHTEYFDFLFSIGHFYGKLTLTIIFFVTLYSAGLFLKNDRIRRNGLRILEAFIFSGLIVTILKTFIGRWRPYNEYGNLAFSPFNFGSNDYLSLSSGDVAIAFAFSTIAASFSENKYWKIFCYIFAVLTFSGRIYHDQHWMSDVILGAFISTMVGIRLIYIEKNSA